MDFTVCELFAGVGGFRLALEGDPRCGFRPLPWRVIWSNQWEPGRSAQYASECYVKHFGAEGHCNRDICTVSEEDIPSHGLLVGGFPCQDYSVAATQAKGIEGRKGVLWWEIHRILKALRPPFVLLENVDRLLKSPASQRGRDMGVMLGCFRDLGYSVEWRVANAADYGFPQKRRRVFIFAFHQETSVAEQLRRVNVAKAAEWLTGTGLFASTLPVRPLPQHPLGLELFDPSDHLPKSLLDISASYQYAFKNAGLMHEGVVFTRDVEPVQTGLATLGSVLQEDAPEEYYIDDAELEQWRYCKGAKRELRRSKTGYEYNYTEGAIPFPDPLDEPARTMLTSEGGRSPNRCTHVIQDPKTLRFRRITPMEAERLNGFPEDWTDTGMPERWRYFCMGNALVVGLVHKMAVRLAEMARPDLSVPRAPAVSRQPETIAPGLAAAAR